MQTEDLTHKFIAVLNEKIPIGVLMNALAHMAAGLSASYPDIPAMRFDSYFDRDRGDHKSISDHPFIILKAENSNQIRNLRQQIINQNLPFITSTHVRENDEYIHFVDFINTMLLVLIRNKKTGPNKPPKLVLNTTVSVCLVIKYF